MADSIRISADEINCLIYAYLQDSGFTHSAFAIRMEGHLERSPYLSKHIPRGELVELLSKSLLYLEVESHWKGDALTSNCKSGFSLLEPHVCSLEPPKKLTQLPPTPHIPISVVEPKVNGPIIELNGKRKSSPVAVEGPTEKRAKRDQEDMDIDSSSESSRMKVSSVEPDRPRMTTPELILKRTARLKPRPQGAADSLTNPKTILLLGAHKSEVFVCAFNPVKPGMLATGSKDAIVNIWNLPNPPAEPSRFAEQPGPPLVIDYFARPEQGDLTSLHWNADGSLLAVGSYDAVLRICSASGGLYFSNPQHSGPIFTTRFSKSGRWLLTASLDGTACVWDVKGKRLHKQYRCHTNCCLDVDWLNDTTFATCGADQVIHVMRIDVDDPIKTFTGHGDEINQIRCNADGTRIATCSDDMTARIWNVESVYNSAESIPGLVASDAVVVLEGHRHSVTTVGWCPNSSLNKHPMVATSSFDRTARLWDSVTGECLKIFCDHRRPVYTLSFSPDGYWLATGSGDGWLHIYSSETKEKKWSWYAGFEKPGVFEIDWQTHGSINRIALALECRQVAVIDVTRIPSLIRDPAGRRLVYRATSK